MADIKKIVEALVNLSSKEVEMLRHAQEHQDIPVVSVEVSPPPDETKWWRRFENKKRKNH